MKHNYEITLIERDGVLYNRDTNKPHSGHSVSYHQNGQKSYEGTYKDGELDGLFTWYYENGQKRAEETYIDGELDGLDTTWYENGQKKVEGTRKDGKLIVVTWWDEDGNVIKQFPPHHVCYF